MTLYKQTFLILMIYCNDGLTIIKQTFLILIIYCNDGLTIIKVFKFHQQVDMSEFLRLKKLKIAQL